MPPEVTVALIGAVALVAATWLNRPARRTQKAAERIEAELKPNGGSSHHDLVNRIASNLFNLTAQVEGVAAEQAHVRAALTSQQDLVRTELAEFRTASEADKEAAREEATRMWSAIEAVAKSEPPHENEESA